LYLRQALWKTAALFRRRVWNVSWNSKKKNTLVLNAVVLFPFMIENAASVSAGWGMTYDDFRKQLYDDYSKFQAGQFDENADLWRYNYGL